MDESRLVAFKNFNLRHSEILAASQDLIPWNPRIIGVAIL
jgi:hypothetical protein